ncbi:hypothetical protein [Kitasatospora sp. NPDC018619]|uniref:hypothetical protein n=1 Tax=unclassified Kitasatospora TaxID=2633591 RepID=UPI0037B31DB9
MGGGVLTPEQQSRIRLDAAGRSGVRFESAHDGRRLTSPARCHRLRQVLRARRCGVPLHRERPAR